MTPPTDSHAAVAAEDKAQSHSGRRDQGLGPNGIGALWMLASVVGATGMTLGVREASADLHTAMIAFLRAALGVIPVLVLLPRLITPDPARRPIRFSAWHFHVIRAIGLCGALNAGFYAIAHLPIATASVLFFLAPVFATIAATAILGEAVGLRRWSAVAAGFVGTLVILRPGLTVFEPAMVAAILSASCFGLCLVVGRLASDRDGSDAVFVSSSVLVAIFTLPGALIFWRLPETLVLWLVIGVVVASSSLRTYADIRAYAIGDVGFLAPFTYLRLITVGVAGWLLFDEVPDAATLGGGAIIIAATLYIAVREARVKASLRAQRGDH
ncbi:MAG: DMT family transporter [Pseudomonadota bacterium]